MKIRKNHLYSAVGVLLAVLISDQPRRQVPTFWETGLGAGETGRFIIQEDGDITLKYVAARLGAGTLELVPVLFYHGEGPATRSIKEIARRFSLETNRPVMAAVNGGFFDTDTGLPIGFLLRDGRMEFFNMPQGFQRSMVGFSSPGASGGGSHIWISSPHQMPKAWLETWVAGSDRPVRTATLAVHHINVPGGKHALALFTSSYSTAIRRSKDAIYFAAQAEPNRPGVYRISEIRRSGSLRIPPNGLVVALHGYARAHADLFQKGALIRPRWSLPADWADHAVAHGLLAGPRLLADGKMEVTAKAERLDSLKSRDRVALAVKENGDALLVWAHKNTPGNLSFEQVAEVLQKMGAKDAIALDGGKSRAILAQAGEALADERYFEGGRPVANALVLAIKRANRS
jgi:hypothetical protein